MLLRQKLANIFQIDGEEIVRIVRDGKAILCVEFGVVMRPVRYEGFSVARHRRFRHDLIEGIRGRPEIR